MYLYLHLFFEVDDALVHARRKACQSAVYSRPNVKLCPCAGDFFEREANPTNPGQSCKYTCQFSTHARLTLAGFLSLSLSNTCQPSVPSAKPFTALVHTSQPYRRCNAPATTLTKSPCACPCMCPCLPVRLHRMQCTASSCTGTPATACANCSNHTRAPRPWAKTSSRPR